MNILHIITTEKTAQCMNSVQLRFVVLQMCKRLGFNRIIALKIYTLFREYDTVEMPGFKRKDVQIKAQ